MSGVAARLLAQLVMRTADGSTVTRRCLDLLSTQDVAVESGRLSRRRAIEVYGDRRARALERGMDEAFRAASAILQAVEDHHGAEVAFHVVTGERGRCTVWTDLELTIVLAVVGSGDDDPARPDT